MNKFTLRQIQVFVLIAKIGNVSQAAKALSLSQSAASTALLELEKQFNCRLFDRDGRKLKLNDLGAQLLPKAVAMLDQAQAIQSLLTAQGQVSGLSVGASMTIGNYYAPKIVARFMQAYPDAQVQLLVHNTDAIVEKILNFELDIGLIEAQVAHPALCFEPWREDKLVVFADTQHALLAKKSVSVKQLLKQDWILREPGSGTRMTFERALQLKLHSMPKLLVKLVLDQNEAIKQAVSSGLGLGCMSALALQEEFASGALVPIKVAGLDLGRHFSIIYHKQKFLSTNVRAFLHTCRSFGL